MITPLFAEVAGRAAELLESEAVDAAWDEASALEEYTVGALGGHLARAVLTADRYLSSASSTPAAGSGLASASRYFQAVLVDLDPVDSEFHRSVRARGAEAAAVGGRQLAARVRRVTEDLARRLDEPTLSRPIEVLDGVTLTVAEYLKTRLVELVVHVDDLAVSVGIPTPTLPDGALITVAGVLGELAARRAGGLRTVRAMGRAERHPEPVRAL